MQLVSTVTVGAGGAASISFTSIPQTGTDLLLVVSSQNTGTSNLLSYYLNSDTTVTNYNWRYLMGTGSGVSSASGNNSSIALNNPSAATASTFANTALYFPNYQSASAKSVSTDSVTENNGTLAYQRLYAASWSGTAAITSIQIFSSNDLAEHSTASLYIITKA
jgi:hypothetical protein